MLMQELHSRLDSWQERVQCDGEIDSSKHKKFLRLVLIIIVKDEKPLRHKSSSLVFCVPTYDGTSQGIKCQ